MRSPAPPASLLPSLFLLALAAHPTAPAAAAAAAATSVLVGRGDLVAPWDAQSASQCSLALSDASATVPWSGLPFLNVSFDFSGGGWNCGLAPSSESAAAVAAVPLQLNLSFSVFIPKGSANTGIVVGVTDAAGNQFGTSLYLGASAGSWTNVSIALATRSFWSNGKNLSLPIKQFELTVSNAKGPNAWLSGWLGVADVSIASGAAPGAIGMPLVQLLVQPRPDTSGVLVAGDAAEAPVSVGCVLLNRLSVPCSASLVVEMRNATGPMGGGDGGFGAWTTCAAAPAGGVPPWASVALSCVIDASASQAGYISVRTVFSGSDCWTANDTAASPVVLEAGVVLALPQPALPVKARNTYAGVFGGQMAPNAASVARIGMRTLREGPLWHWSQPNDCWNLSTCFEWADYDGILADQAAGLEVMIDARELAPPWACAKNDSGGAYSNIPGPDHYADYQRWLTIMLNRYGGAASAIEVSNEQDGYAYFASDHLSLGEAINETLAMINITVAAVAASPNASGLPVMGLSSSMFDVGQTGNGGSRYLEYERAVLSAPGVMETLAGFTFHVYAQGVWVPWNSAPWGNTTFFFPNQSSPGWATNSTVAEVLVMIDELKQQAAAAGLPPDYSPALWLSEMGYNLQLRAAAGSGWAVMHAALVAHLLVHMRSLPIAAYVKKAFYFAADDGCCVESDGYFGLWRPAFERRGAGAADDLREPDVWLPRTIPLAGAAAYATASALVDVPSGRLAGVFVVDNSAQAGEPPYAPSCVAFETDPSSALDAPPLVVLMSTAHHFNDATPANLTIATASPSAILVRNGLGAPMAVPQLPVTGGVQLALQAVALPQYILLPRDVTAAAACRTLLW